MHNVLHTITGLGIGGAQIMLARYLAAVSNLGGPSTVLSLQPLTGIAEQISSERSADLVSLNMNTGSIRPGDMVRLGRAVRRAHPDVIHGWMYHGNIAGTVGAWGSLGFAPVIWSVHHSLTNISLEKPLTQRLIRMSARFSRFTSAISYCSRVSADQHEAHGFDPRRRHVIPNGTDCTHFRPDPARKGHLRGLLGIPDERLLVGQFARFHPMKDQVGLVRAGAALVADGHDLQFVFVGEGHENGPVREAAVEAGISDRVSTPGLRHDIELLMPDLDIYALSSAWGEAFPLAVGEAMASGVPVVTTDVGDSAWLVGSTGIVVPPKDTEALAKGISTLIAAGHDGRKAMGATARERVIEHFSLDQYVKAHQSLYDAVTERGVTKEKRAVEQA